MTITEFITDYNLNYKPLNLRQIIDNSRDMFLELGWIKIYTVPSGKFVKTSIINPEQLIIYLKHRTKGSKNATK